MPLIKPKDSPLALMLNKVTEYIETIDQITYTQLSKLTCKELTENQLKAILTVLLKTGMITQTTSYSSRKQ